MPRLTYLSGLALLLLAGAFLLTDRLLTPPPGVTEANAKRIRPGMSRAWVERVLGTPGADSTLVSWIPSEVSREQEMSRRVWEGPGLGLRIWFDRFGRVLFVERWPAPG